MSLYPPGSQWAARSRWWLALWRIQPAVPDNLVVPNLGLSRPSRQPLTAGLAQDVRLASPMRPIGRRRRLQLTCPEGAPTRVWFQVRHTAATAMGVSARRLALRSGL